MQHIHHTNFDFNYDYLYQLAAEQQLLAKGFTSTNGVKINGADMDFWKIAKFSDRYLDKILDVVELKGKPRFYFQPPFTTIPPHKDHNTTCSWNIVLSDNPAPVTVEEIDYTYKQALLNTQCLHWVNTGAEERVLLKISFFDYTFEQVADRLKRWM
jgi:hypothetical protein